MILNPNAEAVLPDDEYWICVFVYEEQIIDSVANIGFGY